MYRRNLLYVKKQQQHVQDRDRLSSLCLVRDYIHCSQGFLLPSLVTPPIYLLRFSNNGFLCRAILHDIDYGKRVNRYVLARPPLWFAITPAPNTIHNRECYVIRTPHIKNQNKNIFLEHSK